MSGNSLNELSKEKLAQIAKEQLNEDPARIKADIKHIQDWIKKQPHMHKNVDASK